MSVHPKGCRCATCAAQPVYTWPDELAALRAGAKLAGVELEPASPVHPNTVTFLTAAELDTMPPTPRCPHFEQDYKLGASSTVGRAELALMVRDVPGGEPLAVRFKMLLCVGCAEELRIWFLVRGAK